jgi:hypothetical protein
MRRGLISGPQIGGFHSVDAVVDPDLAVDAVVEVAQKKAHPPAPTHLPTLSSAQDLRDARSCDAKPLADLGERVTLPPHGCYSLSAIARVFRRKPV